MSESRSESSQLVERAASMRVQDYDPALVVETVNALQPSGKEKALARIDACLQSRKGKNPAQGLLWVLRVLFEMPAGREYPPVRIGRSAIPPPSAAAALPRFPIVMVRNVPFLAVDKYVLGGKAEPVEVHVAYYRTHGTLRELPLAAPASLDGIEDEFERTWKSAYGDAYLDQVRETIKTQVSRLER